MIQGNVVPEKSVKN